MMDFCILHLATQVCRGRRQRYRLRKVGCAYNPRRCPRVPRDSYGRQRPLSPLPLRRPLLHLLLPQPLSPQRISIPCPWSWLRPFAPGGLLRSSGSSSGGDQVFGKQPRSGPSGQLSGAGWGPERRCLLLGRASRRCLQEVQSWRTKDFGDWFCLCWGNLPVSLLQDWDGSSWRHRLHGKGLSKVPETSNSLNLYLVWYLVWIQILVWYLVQLHKYIFRRVFRKWNFLNFAPLFLDLVQACMESPKNRPINDPPSKNILRRIGYGSVNLKMGFKTLHTCPHQIWK